MQPRMSWQEQVLLLATSSRIPLMGISAWLTQGDASKPDSTCDMQLPVCLLVFMLVADAGLSAAECVLRHLLVPLFAAAAPNHSSRCEKTRIAAFIKGATAAASRQDCDGSRPQPRAPGLAQWPTAAAFAVAISATSPQASSLSPLAQDMNGAGALFSQRSLAPSLRAGVDLQPQVKMVQVKTVGSDVVVVVR